MNVTSLDSTLLNSSEESTLSSPNPGEQQATLGQVVVLCPFLYARPVTRIAISLEKTAALGVALFCSASSAMEQLLREVRE